jgi:hypothetical protein
VTTTIDTIKALFTYTTALVVVVGGGVSIFISRADPAASDTIAIMAGFVGMALTFLFNSEVQTRTARQSASATLAAGAANAAATNGGHTLTPEEIEKRLPS